MDSQYIDKLLENLANKDIQISSKELHDLLEIFESDEGKNYIEEKILKAINTPADKTSDKDFDKIYLNIQKKIQETKPEHSPLVKTPDPRKQHHLIRRLFPYAAIITLILGITVVVISKKTETQPLPIATSQNIVAGTSKAVLVLPNGQQIALEPEGNSLCKQVKGENFVNDGKQLAYNSQHKQQSIQLHTLKTPRGGEYKVVLADGTKVWLNAESELIYPDLFTGNTRKVILSGEAYFEVAKDATKPFYVTVGDMEVKVLGTSFNVSAYPGGKRQTTLAEGRVAVAINRQKVELTPGQQATETLEGLKITTVNIANYVGWKERRFVYEDKLLGEVLEDLKRWYDVEIFIANDDIRNLHLTANLPKYENMNKVLEIIEYATCVKFEVKNRTIVVRLNR